MSFRKALGFGATIVFVTVLGLLLWGFITGDELRVPWVLELTTAAVGGKPTTSMSVEPLGVLAAALLVAVPVWALSRRTNHEHEGHSA